LIFLLKLIEGDVVPPEGAKIDLLIQTAVRKGLLTESYKLSLEGKSILDFLSTPVEDAVYVRSKPKEQDFDRWWKAYPATDTFEHKGKSFTGSRAMRVKKDDCKMKLNNILSEGEYTIDELVKALEIEVLQKKENSVKTSTNKMSYMQNSLTYLNQRTFEPFIELVRQGHKGVAEEKGKLKDIDI
jgi:hypothetical protein